MIGHKRYITTPAPVNRLFGIVDLDDIESSSTVPRRAAFLSSWLLLSPEGSSSMQQAPPATAPSKQKKVSFTHCRETGISCEARKGPIHTTPERSGSLYDRGMAWSLE